MEITKYLTLNDIIKTFSADILPFLRKYHSKCHLANPSNTLIDSILQKIKLEQIVSLRLNAALYWSAREIAPLASLTHIVSLTLFDFHLVELISLSENFFPALLRLSLCCDNGFDLTALKEILQHLHKPIKRLEFRCKQGLCRYACWNHSDTTLPPNFSVEYLLVDLGLSYILLDDYDRPTFLIVLTNLIKHMSNIRWIRLLTAVHNLEKLLFVNEWKSLLYACDRLRKITLEISHHTVVDCQWTEKAMEIEKVLRADRATIKFQLFFV